jgi:hypothetical protein
MNNTKKISNWFTKSEMVKIMKIVCNGDYEQKNIKEIKIDFNNEFNNNYDYDYNYEKLKDGLKYNNISSALNSIYA